LWIIGTKKICQGSLKKRSSLIINKIKFNLYLLFFSISFSLFLSVLANLGKINFIERFRPILPEFLFFLFLTCILFSFLSRFSSFKIQILNYSPPFFLFLLLIPMLIFYINRDDFIGRLLNLILLFIILEIYIFLKKEKGFLNLILKFFLNLSKNLLFLFSFFSLTFLILIFSIRNPYLSGDEPHYYTISSSLLKDGDFDLKNNYSSMDYKYVNPTNVFPHCHEGRNGGWFSFHLPGISFFILPIFPITEILPSPWNVFLLRVFLSFSGILFSFQILRFLRRERFEKEITTPIYFISLLLPPFIFHSFHLYPEMLCAFIGIFMVNEILEGKIKGLRGFFDGFLSGFILFLNQKYYPILALLALFYFYTLLKKRNPINGIINFLIPLITISGLLILYVWSTFGVFSPFSIRKEVSTLSSFSSFFKGFEPLYFLESFLDYFLDQRDGLLPYAPFLFFSLLGLIEMGRKNKNLFLILISISLPYILLYAWNLGRGGYSPFARPLMAISWIFPVSLAYFLRENRFNLLKNFFFLFLSLTLLFEFFLFKYPQFLYQPTTKGITERGGDLFSYMGNLYFYPPKFLPSFIKVPNLSYLPNYFWFIFILAIIFSYKNLKKGRESNWIFLTGFLLFFIFTLVLFPRIRYIREFDFSIGSQQATFFSLSRNIRFSNSHFYVMRDGEYYIPFMTQKRLKKIIFSFESEDFFYLSLKIFDIPFFEGTRMKGDSFYQNPPFLNYKGQKLYLLVLKIKNTRKINPTYKAFFWKIEGY